MLLSLVEPSSSPLLGLGQSDGKVSSYWATGFHFPRSAFEWQWRYTKAVSHRVRADKRLIHGWKQQFLCNFETQSLLAVLLSAFRELQTALKGEKRTSVYTNQVHLVYLTHAQCLWFTKSFSVTWQTPATGSSSLLPSQLSFLSLVTPEQSRNRTFPVLESLLLWEIQPRAVVATNNQDGQYLSLFCFSPNVHGSARFSFANRSPFFQNWFSSGRGHGYVSWIPERDMSVFAWWGQPWDWLPTFWYLGYGLWLVEMQQTHQLIV